MRRVSCGAQLAPSKLPMLRLGSAPLKSRGMRERIRSEEHTSELQSRLHLVCRLLLENKNAKSDMLDYLSTLSITIETIALVSHTPTIPDIAFAFLQFVSVSFLLLAQSHSGDAFNSFL